MKDEFNDYAIIIENDVLSNDFDDIDLYGNKTIETESDELSDSIQYE